MKLVFQKFVELTNFFISKLEETWLFISTDLLVEAGKIFNGIRF
jgi:hypothetical protein